MGAIAIIAPAACALLWVGAVVEFSRTMSELKRCRYLAGRMLAARGEGR